MPEAPQIVWPECLDTETTAASAETAEGILRQLPGGADIPVCSLRRPTVLAFTSPGDGDGKTSLLVALAPQMAKRIAGGVLAVDANFRRPSLTAQLNVPAALGWGGRGAADPEATIQLPTQPPPLLIYPTNLQRLSVLPASHCWGGSCTATPGTTVQLSPQQIEELREGWSLVLLDMASLAHPEVAPLARCCDGVYLVVRLGYTSRRAVRQSARVIRASGSRLLGCVVVK